MPNSEYMNCTPIGELCLILCDYGSMANEQSLNLADNICLTTLTKTAMQLHTFPQSRYSLLFFPPTTKESCSESAKINCISLIHTKEGQGWWYPIMWIHLATKSICFLTGLPSLTFSIVGAGEVPSLSGKPPNSQLQISSEVGLHYKVLES